MKKSDLDCVCSRKIIHILERRNKNVARTKKVTFAGETYLIRECVNNDGRGKMKHEYGGKGEQLVG